ncbi:unnamed protein product [Ascophyllum nodosum]
MMSLLTACFFFKSAFFLSDYKDKEASWCDTVLAVDITVHNNSRGAPVPCYNTLSLRLWVCASPEAYRLPHVSRWAAVTISAQLLRKGLILLVDSVPVHEIHVFPATSFTAKVCYSCTGDAMRLWLWCIA